MASHNIFLETQGYEVGSKAVLRRKNGPNAANMGYYGH